MCGPDDTTHQLVEVLVHDVVVRCGTAIIDSNGAGGGVVYENIDSYRWNDDEGWCGWISSGGLSSGWTDGVSYAAGAAEPRQVVTVEFRGVRYSVETRSTGYWLFAAEDLDGEDYPERVD